MGKGFTLVELSIVLVIIGLLTGGVLAGKSLIIAANLHQTVKTLEQYDVAAKSFKTVYGTVPGDTDAFPPYAEYNYLDGKVNALGDQQLGGLTYSWNLEPFHFWRQLGAADMIEEKFAVYSGPHVFNGNFKGIVPAIKYGTNCFINGYTLSAANNNGDGLSGNAWGISGGQTGALNYCMSASQAHALDKKLDDGRPSFGNIRSSYPRPGPASSDGEVVVGCNNNSTTEYDLSANWYNGASDSAKDKSRVECQLLIKANW